MGTDDDAGRPVLAWWVVAEAGSGLRRFLDGTELWVMPPQWGDGGDDVRVVGRHRNALGRGYVRTVVPRWQLTNFRVRGVHNPDVMRRLTEQITLGWPARMWEGLDQAEEASARWNADSASGE